MIYTLSLEKHSQLHILENIVGLVFIVDRVIAVH